jgi:hypothetical protein
LEAEQVAELGRLYRWVTSDLAYADGHRFDPALRAYLNRLTARAHAYVYGGGIERGRARIARFYTTVFPSEVRRSGGYILACGGLFALTAALAYWLVVVKPSDVYALLPAQLIAPIHKSLHDSNFAFDRDYAATVSAAIIANNVRVASMCFAGGMTLGIFTIYELILTGFMVGGLGDHRRLLLAAALSAGRTIGDGGRDGRGDGVVLRLRRTASSAVARR